MQTKTLLASLAAVAVAGSASAVSPYDIAPGVQWVYQDGNQSNNSIGGGIDMDVTADGVVHMIVRSSNNNVFGVGSTNSINSAVGGISPQGVLLYGTTVSSMPGMTSPNQNYPAGANAVGNKVYYGINAAGQQHWNDPGSVQDPVTEPGKQANTHSVWSIDSSLVAKTGQLDGNASLTTAINDRVSLSIYEDNIGTLRTDLNGPITTGLTQIGVQTRTQDSAMQASTLNIIMVNDMVGGDFGTLGDYGGYNLRNDGTANAYMPGIARYNPTTKVMDGPVKQPIVTDTNLLTGGSNFATYFDAGVDQASGWYYGGGISHARSESTSDGWDPDGTGPATSIPFVNSTSSANTAAIGTAYDSSNVLQYAVTWDTAGVDILNTVVGHGDGTNAAIWGGERGDNAYVEKRDSSGSVVWTRDFDLSLGTDFERVSEVEVIDGFVYVQGYFNNSVGGSFGDGSGTGDTFIAKLNDTDGSVVWLKAIAGGTTDIARDGRQVSKGKAYIAAEADGQWANINGFVTTGNDSLVLQKIVAGDFDSNGVVDMTDVMTVDTATATTLVGVDTYDFDEDGDSSFLDVSFFYLNILDNLPGDTDGDGDIDDADLGTAFSNFTGPTGAAGGKTALEGDTDGDGDVDDADLANAFVGYTGPLGPANVPDPTSLALLGLGGLALIRRRRA